MDIFCEAVVLNTTLCNNLLSSTVATILQLDCCKEISLIPLMWVTARITSNLPHVYGGPLALLVCWCQLTSRSAPSAPCDRQTCLRKEPIVICFFTVDAARDLLTRLTAARFLHFGASCIGEDILIPGCVSMNAYDNPELEANNKDALHRCKCFPSACGYGHLMLLLWCHPLRLPHRAAAGNHHTRGLP